MYSFSGNCAASVPSSTFMCLQAIYIFSGSVHIFPESLMDTGMWKLGLWPRNFFPGNVCFEFSVLVLCSVGVPHPPSVSSLVCYTYESYNTKYVSANVSKTTLDGGITHGVHIFTRDETGLVYLPTQLERTLQLYW